MNTILGQKKIVSQKFQTDGTRIPVTLVRISPNPVMLVKTTDKHGYTAIQLGYGINKKPSKAELGIIKGTATTTVPRFLREVRLPDATPESMNGEMLTVEAVLKPGDIVDVTGTSKGKGFAGGVKRYHFRGGPRTHGQSDRERAPGSIGQTTTPGRVYKGKRMAGKMGHEQVTVRNLTVVDIEGEEILLKGVIPGITDALVKITKVGEKKHFVPIIKDEKPTIVEDVSTQADEVNSEVVEPITEEVKEGEAAQS